MEEARKKLEDYERVSKVQRNLTTENVELEKELSALNTRLEQTEKARKNELLDIKMMYEGQMNTMRDELKSLHNQVCKHDYFIILCNSKKNIMIFNTCTCCNYTITTLPL